MKTPPLKSSLNCALAACLVMVTGGAARGAEPTAARDPTQPPAQFNAPPAVSAGASSAAPTLDMSPIVVVSAGRYYLLDRGHRRSVGDLYGTARIARIDDNGVWLREGDSVQQIPLHGAVARRAVADTDESSDRTKAVVRGRRTTATVKNNPNR